MFYYFQFLGSIRKPTRALANAPNHYTTMATIPNHRFILLNSIFALHLKTSCTFSNALNAKITEYFLISEYQPNGELSYSWYSKTCIRINNAESGFACVRTHRTARLISISNISVFKYFIFIENIKAYHSINIFPRSSLL